MKFIDKNGKLFNKIHVFDVLIVIMVLAAVIGALSKFAGVNVIDLGGGSETVKVQYTIETNQYREEYFSTLKPGDGLAEDKKFFDAEIVEVAIKDYMVTAVDNNGETVVGAHPFQKRAVVKIEAMMDFDDPVYTLGKQEIREGAVVFLTTKTASLSGVVTEFQVVE